MNLQFYCLDRENFIKFSTYRLNGFKKIITVKRVLEDNIFVTVDFDYPVIAFVVQIIKSNVQTVALDFSL